MRFLVSTAGEKELIQTVDRNIPHPGIDIYQVVSAQDKRADQSLACRLPRMRRSVQHGTHPTRQGLGCERPL